ncbi:TetR/AcrR family transcriptional regulator [Rhodobacter sp. SY28-1]|uniref:TetR/AcrR family transcriptional regulator n=1 Tax=Rhodobacter sp. SY28-1 TaxID=2562317 RepID=UPI0010C0DB02|nr:TetR/AcrR family transcriptional regulator [Rhodobacter sp. SY28-1]
MIELRKHPRQNRSRAKVEGILAAAADIVSGRGLEAVTTNAVAARAGISIGSLYQYFPGKAALLAALVRDERANLLEAVERIVCSDAAHSLSNLVDELIEATVAHYLARPALSRTLNLARTQLPPDPEAAEFSARITVLIAARLDELEIPRPETTAQDILAILHGMIDAASEAQEGDRSALADRTRRAVMGYLQVAA